MSSFQPSEVQQCPIARTLDIVGEKWTLLILRDLARGITTFNAIHDDLGCSKSTIAARLTTLERHGIVYKQPYTHPGERERASYQLTNAGVDLLPVLLALQDWGQAHFSQEELVPTHVTHRECGKPVHVAFLCEDGHQVVAQDTAIEYE